MYFLLGSVLPLFLTYLPPSIIALSPPPPPPHWLAFHLWKKQLEDRFPPLEEAASVEFSVEFLAKNTDDNYIVEVKWDMENILDSFSYAVFHIQVNYKLCTLDRHYTEWHIADINHSKVYEVYCP